MPERIQLSRRRGWRMPPNTVKVDRSTRWGNPFCIGDDGVPDAIAAVRLFRRLLQYPGIAASHELFVFTADRIKADLRGRNLACWCTPRAARGRQCLMRSTFGFRSGSRQS
jgi:hypothetical protein